MTDEKLKTLIKHLVLILTPNININLVAEATELRRLEWLGDIERMESNRIKIKDRPKGRRKVGRSRRSWSEEVKDI